MLVENNVFKYDVPEGTVYVEILRAETEDEGPRWADMDHCKVGKPRVQVRTTLHHTYDGPREFVKIRGRRYSSRFDYARLDESNRHFTDRLGRLRKWQGEYRGTQDGHRNENGDAIAWDSKASERLDQIHLDVLDMFEAENPDWRRVSVRLALESDRSTFLGRANAAREEMEQHLATVAQIDAKLAAL